MRKKLEVLLEKKFKGQFRSKYAQVTFTRIPYSEAMKKGKIQDELLMEFCSKVESLDDIDLLEVFKELQKRLNAV